MNLDFDLTFDLWHPEEMQEFNDNFSGDVDADIASVLEEYGPQIVDRAQELCPIGETGNLHDSIYYIVDEELLELYLDAGMSYYPFVEYGTVFQPAQLFCTTAYEEFEPELLQAVDNAIATSAGDY